MLKPKNFKNNGERIISEINAGNNTGPSITSMLRNQKRQIKSEAAIALILVSNTKAVIFKKLFDFDLLRKTIRI